MDNNIAVITILTLESSALLSTFPTLLDIFSQIFSNQISTCNSRKWSSLFLSLIEDFLDFNQEMASEMINITFRKLKKLFESYSIVTWRNKKRQRWENNSLNHTSYWLYLMEKPMVLEQNQNKKLKKIVIKYIYRQIKNIGK